MAATQKAQKVSKSAAESVSGLPFPEYFSALAAKYSQQTGNSTRDSFAASLEDIVALAPINKTSVIHDNAAGPGTATSVLVDNISAVDLPRILITDNVPAMVAGARDSFGSIPTITAVEMDSLKLDFLDSHFTHSILNFSIFTMAEPLKCLQETYRTLRDGGVAALLTWRRFGAGEVIHAAQRLVRPDLMPMAIPNKEFMCEGVLAEMVVKAGFSEEKVKVLEKKVVVKGQDLEGLKGFFLSDFTKPARNGWTEQEVAQWPEAIEQAVQDEISREGGVLFEVWVVLATK